MVNLQATLLRELPPVHRLLGTAEAQEWQQAFGRTQVLRSMQDAVDILRSEILSGQRAAITDQEALLLAHERLLDGAQLSLRAVINATGTVIHTNLGRAPLADEALQAIVDVAKGYSNLEYNLQQGVRGHRYEHVESLLCELTGAEAALVVNNNAAAVFLVLTELAKGKRVAISRGELVEIGGSFRVSEVMRASGAELYEIGTTNKTHAYDYETALQAGADMVLRVHTSNFRMIGFTYKPSLDELVTLSHAHGAILYEDLGSGSLVDLRARGIGDEPTVRASVEAGVDVVTFSGDKLLGGAQAGIICGRTELIERIRKNQLARAVRVDKLTLAALLATLHLYQDEDRAFARIPVLRMLSRPLSDLQESAERLARELASALAENANVRVDTVMSQVGGGALPTEQLPSYAVVVSLHSSSAAECVRKLRLGTHPVIARVTKEEVILDVRTIEDEQFTELIECVRAAVVG